MKETLITVWITKYALTSGIIEIEARVCNNDMIEYGELHLEYVHGEGTQWHRSHETAIFRAEEMKIKKIKSLQKNIKKLEDMTFT